MYLLTAKHKIRTITNKKVSKSSETFLCKKYIRNYIFSKRYLKKINIFQNSKTFLDFSFLDIFFVHFSKFQKSLGKKNIKKIRKICDQKNSYGVIK